MTIRNAFIVFFLIISLNSFSQDSLWKQVKVDENMTILFPSDFVKSDTILQKGNKRLRFLVYKAVTPFASLGLTVTPQETDINVDNSESLKDAYKGVEEGVKNSSVSKGYNVKFTDTVIKNIATKKALLVNEYSTLVIYIFILNDKMYQLIYSPLANNNYSTEDERKLLNGIDFIAGSIKEKKFASKAESWGYKIGYLIGWLFFPALIIVLIIYLVKRKK